MWVKVFLSTCLLFPVTGKGQSNRYFSQLAQPVRYVVLPDSGYIQHTATATRKGEKPSEFLVKHGYQSSVDAQLELYNLLLPGKQVNTLLAYSKGIFQTLRATDTLLVSFAVLPYTDGTITWQPVHLDTLRSYVYSFPDFIWEANKRLWEYRQAGSPGQPELLYRNDICPILHRDGQYWLPRPYVLTGYFQVRPYASRRYSRTDMATINVRGRMFPKAEIVCRHQVRVVEAVPAGNVLTGVAPTGYEFWLNGIQYSHPPTLLVYGYNNFRYKPGIGIVSGTFEAYFSESVQVVSGQFFEIRTIDGQKVE